MSKARNTTGVFMICFLLIGALGATAAELSFQRVEVANNTDSQFTNVADVNRDGKPDVLAFKGGNGGFLSWYGYPGFKHHIVRRGDFNAGRPTAADIDKDGDLDVLAGRFTRPNPPDVPPPHDIRIYFNPGKGRGDWKKQVVRNDGGIYFGHLADIGNDGDLDIVGPRTYFTGPIRIFVNQSRSK